MENRCKFWLSKKNRFCANIPLQNSSFCGNHTQRSDGRWIPCPIDSSHSVLEENLEGHLNRCPFLKQAQSLSAQPFYQKGINAGIEDEGALSPPSIQDNVTSEMKRNAVYGLGVSEFSGLIRKIESVHGRICKDINESYKIPEACARWINREVDRKIPFQEKHVKQGASILGNLEDFEVLRSHVDGERYGCMDAAGNNDDDGSSVPAVVEFGAGRGYLTQMLSDCYGVRKVFLVERKSYKLKADRSLRQNESLVLERLRIDIEDLDLKAIEALQGLPYLAIGKHLCGPATDLSLRCCLATSRNKEQLNGNLNLRGLAIATCCHHLCQWKHYTNKKYMISFGISREEFHAITWFTSWAVDADHSSDLSEVTGVKRLHLDPIEKEECCGEANGVDGIVRNMKAVERARLGFICKQIIDMGRLMWVKEQGLETKFVKYVPSSISPENHLIIARNSNHF